MSDTSKRLTYEFQNLKKQVEILKAKIRGELLVLDKILDVEDVRELEESYKRLSYLIAGHHVSVSYPSGLLGSLEDLKRLERRLEEEKAKEAEEGEA